MTASPLPLLAADAIGMRFGQRVLFDGLSFSAGPGALALLGGNGSGKSTLISLLCGIAAPDQGAIRVLGHDMRLHPRKAKAHLAYVPDDSVAYEFMTGADFLGLVDALRGTSDARHAGPLIDGFGLDVHIGERFETMSLGTRKKFMLVSGLMSRAEVVLLDEPTNGIDAESRQFLIALIRREAAQRLFFFSTHDAGLVEATEARHLRLERA